MDSKPSKVAPTTLQLIDAGPLSAGGDIAAKAKHAARFGVSMGIDSLAVPTDSHRAIWTCWIEVPLPA